MEEIELKKQEYDSLIELGKKMLIESENHYKHF